MVTKHGDRRDVYRFVLSGNRVDISRDDISRDRPLFSYFFSGILMLLAEFFVARYRDKVYDCLLISYHLCAADAGRRNVDEVRHTGERWQACRASRGWSSLTLPIM